MRLPCFFYELIHLDTVCFEKFLELYASEYPEDLYIIKVDNGGFHNSLNLRIPENVILLFQLAYSPEVNGSIPVLQKPQMAKRSLR